MKGAKGEAGPRALQADSKTQSCRAEAILEIKQNKFKTPHRVGHLSQQQRVLCPEPGPWQFILETEKHSRCLLTECMHSMLLNLYAQIATLVIGDSLKQ